MVVSTASSAATMSSPTGVYSIINQFQLYILLPMLPPYFPEKVGDFILGVDFSLLSLNFLPFKSIPFLEGGEDLIDYPQSEDYLEAIGLESMSSIMNYLNTF